MQPTKTLRLILGDQLNANHSWYRDQNDSVVYVIAELKQESEYVTHHIQKLCGFFAAMTAFSESLLNAGHRVLHLTLDNTANDKDLSALVFRLCEEYGCQTFEYQRPDELRLAKQLADIELPNGVSKNMVDTEHFMLPYEDIEKEFKPQKNHRLEAFYRRMRLRFNILVQDGQPEGGQWNFDQNNRERLQ